MLDIEFVSITVVPYVYNIGITHDVPMERDSNVSPRHKHWPAGPAHFSDRRASSGQYILSFTGPYGPPRYMSGHQLSNSAGPEDDKSQDVFFARARAPHLGSFRVSPFTTTGRQRGASRSRACQSNTLTSVFRSRRTRYFNANIRDASGHFSPRST